MRAGLQGVRLRAFHPHMEGLAFALLLRCTSVALAAAEKLTDIVSSDYIQSTVL
jgi:hypothetical protein